MMAGAGNGHVLCEHCGVNTPENEMEDHPTEEVLRLCKDCIVVRQRKITKNARRAPGNKRSLCDICADSGANMTACDECELYFCAICIRGSRGRIEVAASQVAGWQCWRCSKIAVAQNTLASQKLGQVTDKGLDELTEWIERALAAAKTLKTLVVTCPKTNLDQVLLRDAANPEIRIKAEDARLLSNRARTKAALVRIFLEAFADAQGVVPNTKSGVHDVYEFFVEVSKLDNKKIGKLDHFRDHWRDLNKRGVQGIPVCPKL